MLSLVIQHAAQGQAVVRPHVAPRGWLTVAPRSSDAMLELVDVAFAALDAVAQIKTILQQPVNALDPAREVGDRRGGTNLRIGDAPAEGV